MVGTVEGETRGFKDAASEEGRARDHNGSYGWRGEYEWWVLVGQELFKASFEVLRKTGSCGMEEMIMMIMLVQTENGP